MTVPLTERPCIDIATINASHDGPITVSLTARLEVLPSLVAGIDPKKPPGSSTRQRRVKSTVPYHQPLHQRAVVQMLSFGTDAG